MNLLDWFKTHPETIPSTQQRELIGTTVELPGRFPIYTEGMQFDLAERVDIFQEGKDSENFGKARAMIVRLAKHVRDKLHKGGSSPEDWRVTVTVAVHHKGEITDIWMGDAPERHRVSQALPEHLKKPDGAKRINVK